MDQSKQAVRDYCGDGNGTCVSSLREITLIETVTSFLEEHGASEIDRKVLRKLAEALSKSIDDFVEHLEAETIWNEWLLNKIIKDKGYMYICGPIIAGGTDIIRTLWAY